jgi:hypothetical protein
MEESMKRLLSLCILGFFAVQSGMALADQKDLKQHRHPNPERRGIGTKRSDEIRKYSGKHKAKEVAIDERKSLFITDVDILKHFTFDELMAKLVHDSGNSTLTKERLFKQWWDTANKKTEFNLGLGGPNCDSPEIKDLLNGFAYECPRDEGDQVKSQPFGPPTPETYTAIALVNRFDLADAPADAPGHDCGEYRIVFERNSGADVALNRNLIIFEAVLRNPQPKVGSLEGCLPVQQFWAKLSEPGKSVKQRAELLHDFYYEMNKKKDKTGLRKKGFDAVVMAKNYGSATTAAPGQVRTNQFMTSMNPPTTQGHAEWLLREFHIVKDSAMGVRFMPHEDANNPPALLFNETDSDPKGKNFRSEFPNHVEELSKDDINLLKMDMPDEFDSPDSEETAFNPPGPMNYPEAFKNSPQFKDAIQARIDSSLKLTAEDIVKRAQTQTCAGCHRLSAQGDEAADLGGGRKWPKSLGFTHAQLKEPEDGPDGKRFEISEALKKEFLPHRRKVMMDFLKGQ